MEKTIHLLATARRRQAVAVVDAGTLRAPGTRELLSVATHVISCSVSLGAQ